MDTTNLDGYTLEINESLHGVTIKLYHCYEDECLGKLTLNEEQQKTLKKMIKECKNELNT